MTSVFVRSFDAGNGSNPRRRHRSGRSRRRLPTRSAHRRDLRARLRRRHQNRRAIQRLHAEGLEQRRLLAFDLVAAYSEGPVPFFVTGDTSTPQLSEAPQQITLRFAPSVAIKIGRAHV